MFQPLPKTPHEFLVLYRDFIRNNLAGIISPTDRHLKKWSDEVANKAAATAKAWDLEDQYIPGLAKLWLYDLVILCGK